MAVEYNYELYVDGERVFYSNSSFYIDVEADGFVDTTGMAFGEYTYAEGAYLGWTTTQGGTTPDYVVGDTISVGSGTINLYSIPSVTNLTNTKWLFNDAVEMQGHIASYNVTFSSNNNNYTLLEVTRVTGEPVWYLWYNTTKVNTNTTPAVSGNWVDEAYRTIEITGGTDVTNATLIAWLTANATQITSGGSMYIGTSTISKMYIGQDEVEKIYFGQDLVYEKQAPSGFSGNILSYEMVGSGIGTQIKFETPPSNVNDYDAAAYPGGSIDGATNFSGKTKIYAWGFASYGTPIVKINNVETAVSTNYGTPTEITLNGNYDIYLGNAVGSG